MTWLGKWDYNERREKRQRNTMESWGGDSGLPICPQSQRLKEMGHPALLPRSFQSLLAQPPPPPGQFRGSTVSRCLPLELGPCCVPPFPEGITNEKGGWGEEEQQTGHSSSGKDTGVRRGEVAQWFLPSNPALLDPLPSSCFGGRGWAVKAVPASFRGSAALPRAQPAC